MHPISVGCLDEVSVKNWRSHSEFDAQRRFTLPNMVPMAK